MIRPALVALVLAGCAPTVAPVASGAASCRADAALALVGKPSDTALDANARRLTGAKLLRRIAPGDMVTMDYRADRINVDTDASGIVTGFRCG